MDIYKLVELERQLENANDRLDNLSLPFGKNDRRYNYLGRIIRELEHKIYIIKAGK